MDTPLSSVSLSLIISKYLSFKTFFKNPTHCEDYSSDARLGLPRKPTRSGEGDAGACEGDSQFGGRYLHCRALHLKGLDPDSITTTTSLERASLHARCPVSHRGPLC
jgi:hypothetical protein